MTLEASRFRKSSQHWTFLFSHFMSYLLSSKQKAGYVIRVKPFNPYSLPPQWVSLCTMLEASLIYDWKPKTSYRREDYVCTVIIALSWHHSGLWADTEYGYWSCVHVQLFRITFSSSFKKKFQCKHKPYFFKKTFLLSDKYCYLVHSATQNNIANLF